MSNKKIDSRSNEEKAGLILPEEQGGKKGRDKVYDVTLSGSLSAEIQERAALQQSGSSVLILSKEQEVLGPVSDAIRESSKGVTLVSTSSIAGFREELSKASFDLVIIDQGTSGYATFELIHESRFQNSEPAILVLEQDNNPGMISAILHSGCQRCISKVESWKDELLPAIRQALRLKRLEDENRTLVRMLTEMNYELEKRNERLDEFNATVAHDIRGILAGVTMRLEYVLGKRRNEFNEETASILSKALKAAQRAVDIVHATYEYARLGRGQLKKESVDIGVIVRDAISDLNLPESLDIKVGIGELPKVWGNGPLLRRVFMNLISNSVKYNDKESIVIDVGCSGTVREDGREYAEIFVADNGPGIPQAVHKEIFRMFWRGTKARRSGDGMGVGLAVVQKVVELHGGKIAVSNGKKGGVRFSFLLPITSD
ncbi:MAG: hypothetical protein D6808_07435 [Candidatus Dadabacteria bacterium]|nr:MAG: hypothetical protein D6808_07435 [Candidatus Dadabacteria bacterium]